MVCVCSLGIMNFLSGGNAQCQYKKAIAESFGFMLAVSLCVSTSLLEWDRVNMLAVLAGKEYLKSV